MTDPAGAAWGAAPPSEPVVVRGEVHLWRIELKPEPARVAAGLAGLDAEERARHARFRFQIHRDRFALRRAALRGILGRYLRADPAGLRFRVSGHGKPELAEPEPAEPDAAGPGAAGPRPEPLRFNLSHSEDLALVGITRGCDLGVDVERVRPLPDRDAIARRFFSAAEIAEYHALPAEVRGLAFHLAWTRKEAWLKARGEGLIGDLDGFDVRLAPGGPPELRRVAGDPDEAARWTLLSEEPAAGFVAAVAIRHTGPRIARYRAP